MALNEEYLQIGYDIIGAAYEVRNTSGRQFREIYYRRALSWELRQKGYDVKNEVLIPVLYKGVEIDDAYKADIVVDDRVVIEVKAVGKMWEAYPSANFERDAYKFPVSHHASRDTRYVPRDTHHENSHKKY